MIDGHVVAVRGVALTPMQDLARGDRAQDTGHPIQVAVGPVTLGHVFNVLGATIATKPPLLEGRRPWPSISWSRAAT